MSTQLCVVVVRSAHYIGDSDDGVYFSIAEVHDGWWMSAIVNCDSAGFVTDLVTDDGPHPSSEAAHSAGVSAAVDWCIVNNVDWGEDDEVR